MSRITLGTVGHFGITVRDAQAAFDWWKRSFDMEEMFRGEDWILITNANVTMLLQNGEPHPEVLGHMSFHLPSIDALRSALEVLKSNGVEVEDPGDEIGPEAPGSKNMGLWFHDPDGYRWELSVLARS